MLHPTVRDNLEEQYSVIEAARRERETRSASDAGRVSGHQSQDRIKSPGQPGHNVNYHLPSAPRNPVQSSFISRSASAHITRSNVSGTSTNASSGQRSNFLSGEIAPESDVEERGQSSMSSRSLARAFSTSASTAASSQNELPPSPTRRVHPEMTAFMSGSVSRSSPRVTATTSRSPLSSPPISAVPARFTPSSTANVGPGSLYSSQEVNPFSASFGSNKKAHSVGDSPRSSVSSKSNNLSLRWSSGSSKTTSTSRTTPNQVSTSDDVMIISNPPGGIASSDKKRIDPSAFSWLSFEEEEEYQEETEKSIAPTMERKNSLWRESLDSLASSRLELDEDEDVLAHHFPQPPPMSRSNSVATTTVPDSEFHTPPDSLDLSDESAGTPLSEIGDVSRFSMHSDAPSPSPSIASPAAPSISRKSSISEMLRVHVVSPLGRSRSKGNTKSMPESKGPSKKEKPAKPIRSESSSSSSSSMGRPPLPHQGLCLA